jgi:hypothetical protein
MSNCKRLKYSKSWTSFVSIITTFIVGTVIAGTRTLKCLIYDRRQCDNTCMYARVSETFVSHCLSIVRSCRDLQEENGR